MRAVIASAEVGDDVLGDDPTTAALERYAAELLGKESALFFPSGIMANQAAIIAQAPSGSEVLLDAGAHILIYEEGAAAAWAGAQLRPIPSEDGSPDLHRYAAAFGTGSRYLPRPSLVCFENTHNTAGGRVLSLEVMAAIVEAARERDLRVHLDGARLPNASVAAGRPMRHWADLADTVMVSLSKGLGAPVGSVLAGPAPLMDEIWRIRRRLGGGMRQAGILAAAGLYALRNNLAGLAADHRRAREIATSVGRLEGVTPSNPETNIVLLDLDPAIGAAPDVVRRLEAAGVLTTAFGPHRIRAVTHRDLDDSALARAIAAFERAIDSGR
jgi:threonine aldolase